VKPDEIFEAEGLSPTEWSNGPGYRYAEHRHPYHKVLVCVRGSITFHTPDGDIRLSGGDRLDLPAGTRHAATVGSGGVTCWEAARSR
jgi:quercetin dioxygenase-like cupin family protein